MIKQGDHIKAFLKKSPGVPDELVGREASPFAGRASEEVTKVEPGSGFPSDPVKIKTKFSDYRLDEWKIVVVPIESFVKIEPAKQVVCYKVMGITSPYSVVACYSQPQHPDKVVCELRGPTKAFARCARLNKELEEQRREDAPCS